MGYITVYYNHGFARGLVPRVGAAPYAVVIFCCTNQTIEQPKITITTTAERGADTCHATPSTSSNASVREVLADDLTRPFSAFHSA